MANRKTNYKPDYYSSMCGNHETFGTIYKSMLVSEQFKELSLSARFIYCLCRCQLTSSNGRQTLYNHGKENNIDYPANCFVFPAKHIKEYGLDRSNVSKHLTELERAGFIKRYEKKRTSLESECVSVFGRVEKQQDIMCFAVVYYTTKVMNLL